MSKWECDCIQMEILNAKNKLLLVNERKKEILSQDTFEAKQNINTTRLTSETFNRSFS